MIDEKELKSIIKEDFISDINQKESEEILSKAVKLGIDFKLSKNTKKPVVNYKEQNQIMMDLLEEIPIKGKNINLVLDEFKNKIMDGSVNFSSPNFIAFPDCGNSLAALTGHILFGMLNQNLINSIHTSPTATFVEMAVINWLRSIVGYKVNNNPKDILDVGGINVTGGVSANTVGLLLARENKFPGTINKGLQCDPKKLRVFLPRSIGHYSITAALGWMGLGKDNAIEVDTTPGFTIDQKDLIKKIKKCKDNGEIPLALVAYTGDSRTMAIDDFPELYKIAKENDMWFHIDACHGLSLCFSDKLKEKVKGIELADSITIDPHKVLFTPYTSSYILIKEPRKFGLIAGVSDLITKEQYSFGQITPLFGSRAFNSLKVWFLIKHLGKEKIGQLIEHRHDMVKYFASLVEKTEDFYMMNDVTINSAVYLYVPKKLKEELYGPEKLNALGKINTLNKNIQFRIFKEGQYYIHTFQLNDFKNVMGLGTEIIFQMQRLMLGNPLTTKETLNKFIEYSNKIAKEEALIMGHK
ncbi:pyridoxal-dependent decarboxylase [Candidatus Woesearchaeota archaeon]|nr:hypothetical protein [uncultured archaeon]MBS3108145.1 pyridoxal-dependent decarboxylase [Candidatus Woesearchaeota archaeon]